MDVKESGASTPEGGAKGDAEAVKTVSVEDHKRALDDLHKFKSERTKAAEALNAAKAELESLKNQRLAEKEDYKTLAETYSAKLKEKETELTQFRDGFYTAKKYDAVYASALKAGLRAEAESDLTLLPLDGVEVERTDHGRVMVHGAESFVEKMKREKPHWFKTNDPPRINAGGGKSAPAEGPITPDTLWQLEKAARSGGQKEKDAFLKAKKEHLAKRGLTRH